MSQPDTTHTGPAHADPSRTDPSRTDPSRTDPAAHDVPSHDGPSYDESAHPGRTDDAPTHAGRPAPASTRPLPRSLPLPLPHGPTTLLVIAKEPRPGRVKTRLTPYFTPDDAALLAAAALADTLRTVCALPARRRVLVLDGAPGPWLPPGVDVVPQVAGGLDERLAAAFALPDGPALLVGMDTPQITGALLAPAVGPDAWRDCDAWFGPADDGGFWALGLAAPDPDLLRGVPMSTSTTGAVQRARLTAAGLRVRDLPRLRDVDTPDDARHVAASAPPGRFTATLDALTRAGTR